MPSNSTGRPTDVVSITMSTLASYNILNLSQILENSNTQKWRKTGMTTGTESKSKSKSYFPNIVDISYFPDIIYLYLYSN